MKVTINVPDHGTIEFTESAWTGKKTLAQNGAPCQKTGKNTFALGDGTTAELKGNFLRGAVLSVGGKEYRLIPAAKWYEYVLAVLPLVFNLVWGNVVDLVAIFPIVGGAIGGAICGACFVLSLLCMRRTERWWAKVLIGLALFAVSVLICYAIALAILSPAAA